MAEAPSESALFFARLTVALIVVFIVLGVFWNGFSVEVHNRIWKDSFARTLRIVLLGLVMDMIYQYEVLRTFYPGEAALMVLPLVLIPYFVLRDPIAHVARNWV
jgi:hypothetical protein